MTTDTAKLIAELRVIGCHQNGEARCTCGIGMEAADAIEDQSAEIARLTAERETMAEALCRELRQRGYLLPQSVMEASLLKLSTAPTGDEHAD